jgi:hypothetical protein
LDPSQAAFYIETGSLDPVFLGSRALLQPECQRRRRADYHRQKIETDPVYAQVVVDSRKQWR